MDHNAGTIDSIPGVNPGGGPGVTGASTVRLLPVPLAFAASTLPLTALP